VAALEEIAIGRTKRLACAQHAEVARNVRPRSIAALRRATAPAGERRASTTRRLSGSDRRAFWRPTPDRRREERELGRRGTDASGSSK
jgi:hypothetical protein